MEKTLHLQQNARWIARVISPIKEKGFRADAVLFFFPTQNALMTCSIVTGFLKQALLTQFHLQQTKQSIYYIIQFSALNPTELSFVHHVAPIEASTLVQAP